MRKVNQTGSILIFVTLGFALLGVFVGFAIDFGKAYLARARVSRLVDGAALAAAKALKGQPGFQNDATEAACDSMLMNGAKVQKTAQNTCTTIDGGNMTVTVEFVDEPVSGGPPMKFAQVTGLEPVPTNFMGLLGFLVPGDYSTIPVSVMAQAGPERPVDLMLVLDRSASMAGNKIATLKSTVNEFLDNNFSGNDRIGMVSFGYRGCGNASGSDNTAAINCQPDVALSDATSANINSLKNRINGLDAGNGTNTMEALRTARGPMAATFNDPTRVTARKAVLLVTDGKPTAMRRDTNDQCRRNPKTNALVPGWDSGSFPDGCIQVAVDANGQYATRRTLSLGNPVNVFSSNLFLDTISCFRSLHDCDSGTNGAVYEADLLRNCGFNNSACAGGGEHDVLVFAIGIGQVTSTSWSSFDKHAKCMLARIANANDVLNTGTNTRESINTVCTPPPPLYADDDTYAELRKDWPCATGPCINSSQERGQVYIVDETGDVEAQLRQIFNEIAALLKLRLTV